MVLECCKEREAIRENNPTIAAFEDSVLLFVQNSELDMTKPEDVDRLLLSTKPS